MTFKWIIGINHKERSDYTYINPPPLDDETTLPGSESS